MVKLKKIEKNKEHLQNSQKSLRTINSNGTTIDIKLSQEPSRTIYEPPSIIGLVWFGGFYGISTFVGYLTPNPFLCK